MTHFIIDTPAHKRWWLPDGRHQYNQAIHGQYLYFCVIDSFSNEIRQSGTFDMDKPGWESLMYDAQELANKKYPKPLRYRRRV